MPVPKTYYVLIGPTTVPANGATSLADCQLLDLTKATQLILTFRGSFHAGASNGVKIQMFPSYDGVNFDSHPWADWGGVPAEWVITPSPGATKQVSSEPIFPGPKYLKFVIVNQDNYPVTQAVLVATVQTVG
ncbi:MAG: hypothetical protein QXX12_06175 [Nanopusillaceae archaeon]